MTSTIADQGFSAYNAKLLTTDAPYDPSSKVGNPDDEAYYTKRPGIDFLRPWLAVQDDIAFQWPLGMEGFDYVIDPVLSKHTFIGDNGVEIDVVNTGEETISLNGNFPGLTSASQMQALTAVVKRSSQVGKILFVPYLMSHAQRVQVSHFETGRDQGARGSSITYTIDFEIVGQAGSTNLPSLSVPSAASTASARGSSARSVASTPTYNTLRKIAAWKLGTSDQWSQLYALNSDWFDTRSIVKAQAPDYRLPPGTMVYF